MELNDAIRSTKQTFLIQNIIEQKYDSDGFAEYMLSLKPDGSDIDNWTFDELMKVVEDYKRVPRVAFPRVIDFTTDESYKKVQLKIEENNFFRIEVSDLQSSVLRSFADLIWVAKTFASEYPSIHVYKQFKTKDIIENEQMAIREDSILQIRYFIEYLYTYFYTTSSQSLVNFFTLPNDGFQKFKKVLL
jgi:hypothetical protein